MMSFSAVIGFSSVAKLCCMLHSIFLRGSSIPDDSHLVYLHQFDPFPSYKLLLQLFCLILPKTLHLHPWILIRHCRVLVMSLILPMLLDVVVPAMSHGLPLSIYVRLYPICYTHE
ncbi:hypothetical protein B0H14DRAFT_1174701 [Mycena olivaceomarginata]|nr:hypothetical protein B0H14DRAFT_1174701 [Mycena olivaceomarginata]